MSKEYFDQQIINSNSRFTLFTVIFTYLVIAIVNVLGDLFVSNYYFQDQIPDFSNYKISIPASLFIPLVLGPIAFYTHAGFVYLGSKLLKGNGKYKTQIFLHSLFLFPTSVVISLSYNLIQFPQTAIIVFSIITLISTGFYSLILRVRSVASAHSLSTGNAIVAVVVFPLIGTIFFSCFLFATLPMIIGFLQIILGNTQL
jgi:hypothetical protein